MLYILLHSITSFCCFTVIACIRLLHFFRCYFLCCNVIIILFWMIWMFMAVVSLLMSQREQFRLQICCITLSNRNKNVLCIFIDYLQLLAVVFVLFHSVLFNMTWYWQLIQAKEIKNKTNTKWVIYWAKRWGNKEYFWSA